MLQNTAQEIEMILSTLSPREEAILRKRFGIGDDKTHTLEELGHGIRGHPRARAADRNQGPAETTPPMPKRKNARSGRFLRSPHVEENTVSYRLAPPQPARADRSPERSLRTGQFGWFQFPEPSFRALARWVLPCQTKSQPENECARPQNEQH